MTTPSSHKTEACLLYTSDAADEEDSVDLGGRRIIKKNVENMKKPRVFVQVGVTPLVTVKKDSFVNDFIEFAGGINITKDLKNAVYSREKVLEDNPDVIIIVTMGLNGEEEKKAWQRFRALNAVKNGRIYIIDSDAITSPTPFIFADTLGKIATMLHPALGGVS